MSLRYYFDQHVPLPVARALRRMGIDVITAEEDGARDWDDEALLIRAYELGCVIVTNDDDFHSIASRWRKEARTFAGIGFMTRQRIPHRALIESLRLMDEAYGYDDMLNRIEYLPL